MGMNPRLLRPQASGARHPEALDWAARATANGGTVDTTSLAAADAFCRAIDAGGIRDKLSFVNLLIGGNLNAALVPLYRSFSRGGTTYGDATATNNNFTGDNYTLSGGLNVATTGRNLVFGTALSWATSVFDLHIGVGFSNTAASGNFNILLHGAFDSNNRTFVDMNSGNYRGNLGGSSVANAGIASQIGGRFVTSRVSQTSIRSYHNNAAGTENTTSISDVDRSSLNTQLGGTAGSGFSFWYCHMGTGLTASNVSILDAAFVSYLTIMGRS
jgi:hypothetical protein